MRNEEREKKKERKSDTLNNNVIEDALLHEGSGRARIFLGRHRSLALGGPIFALHPVDELSSAGQGMPVHFSLSEKQPVKQVILFTGLCSQHGLRGD